MSGGGTFDSASGLRPMSAFVVISAVLGTVASWVPCLAQRRDARQPERLVREAGEPSAFRVVDRGGRVLAQSVPRFDLEMSPRSMWQAHTPDYMAERISALLGGEPTPAALLERMLPGARDGWIAVDAWELDARRAERLLAWIAAPGEDEAALPGIQLLAIQGQADASATGASAATRFRVHWNPAQLLASALRLEHGAATAVAWGRRVADGFARALRAPQDPGPQSAQEWAEARESIWEALFPNNHARPVSGIPREHALELRELLVREGVSPWQMRLDYASERVHPCGEHELIGSWGFPDAQAKRPEPRSGLELAAARLLQDGGLDLAHSPDVYLWTRDRNVRGERGDGFVGFLEGSAVPSVRSTLDLDLQRFVGETLARVLAEHRPALAMAIVLDVESGDVLAVDSAEAYAIAPFAPVYHTFTPGSTLKMVTMAVALDQGVVEPDTRFDVGPVEPYWLVCQEPFKSGRGSRELRRPIHEAEGSLRNVISATESLAFSVNAGLVQIGLLVSGETFHDYLVRLGYGAVPGSGLGIEKQGWLTKLPWSRTYTQASVSFGHELTTTLWQHATALATVVRGGVLRPLRLFTDVEQGERVVPLAVPEGSSVFTAGTCAEVRAMMRLGASAGTGAPVLESMRADERWRRAAEVLAEAGIELATKTGTAEKTPSELCVHVELSARERWAAQGIPATRQRFLALRDEPRPHRSCYTSSMCAFARSPETGREVLVLVVVDEPRGLQKFGSRVAGPAAFAILAEALGLTHDGRTGLPTVAGGFVAVEPAGGTR